MAGPCRCPVEGGQKKAAPAPIETKDERQRAIQSHVGAFGSIEVEFTKTRFKQATTRSPRPSCTVRLHLPSLYTCLQTARRPRTCVTPIVWSDCRGLRRGSFALRGVAHQTSNQNISTARDGSPHSATHCGAARDCALRSAARGSAMQRRRPALLVPPRGGLVGDTAAAAVADLQGQVLAPGAREVRAGRLTTRGRRFAQQSTGACALRHAAGK